ncbi:MAG: hypothetical protein NW215_11520 [Hyphomicrobiales bacterium]|nr:hypothetical protein [Hyphomicrobiales bacterium]
MDPDLVRQQADEEASYRRSLNGAHPPARPERDDEQQPPASATGPFAAPSIEPASDPVFASFGAAAEPPTSEAALFAPRPRKASSALISATLGAAISAASALACFGGAQAVGASDALAALVAIALSTALLTHPLMLCERIGFRHAATAGLGAGAFAAATVWAGVQLAEAHVSAPAALSDPELWFAIAASACFSAALIQPALYRWLSRAPKS